MIPLRLYDAFGQLVSVKDGLYLTQPSGLLTSGSDENSFARVSRIESKFNAEVSIDALAYGARFSPYNSAFTSGASMYTRNTWGHIATAATTNVKIVEATSVSGMFLSSSTGTPSFKIVSASVNDAAAGTGIRTINIVYIGIDGLRYLTSATMNGTTVVTVALNPFAVGVEQVYATSLGTGLSAAGAITVKDSTSATTMGEINTGNTLVVTTEQPIQIGRTLYLCGIRASAKTTACRIGVKFFGWDLAGGTATGAQALDGESFRIVVGSVVYIPFNPPIPFKTPAGQVGRLWLTVTPDAVTASDYWAAMDTFEAIS